MTAKEWTPADQDARDRIIRDAGENMCVEAGAGTGKTTVLVDRIVELLRRGPAEVHELVVITFTEKAAAELSARVRIGLEQACAEATDEDARSRLAGAIRGLGAARIETIHAFASSLLRERPFEAGLDPGFAVLDVMPGRLAFEAAYNDWITEQMAQEPPPAALVEALSLGLEFRLVRDAAERLHTHRDVLPLAPYAVEPFDAHVLIAAIREALAKREQYTCSNDENKTYKEFERVRELQAQLISLVRAGRPTDDVVAETKDVDAHLGNQIDWFPRNSGPKDALKEIKAALAEAQQRIKQGATARLVAWAQDFVSYYDARRKAEGQADFDDLLIWARNLVRDNAEVCAYFQSKYRYVFVDEFQDTDPLQAEMIVRLCAEEDPGADWRQARLRPGSLFVVGDPKQSIYRFRRADITMYDDVKRQVFGGRPVNLTQNFRSGGAIIDWVNAHFERLIIEDAGRQPAYIPLDGVEAYEAGSVAIMPIVAQASSRAGVTEGRISEAAAIASLLVREVGAGSWRVRDQKTNEMRPARYSDVAVIIPMRTQFEYYEDALTRAGVPYRHGGGRSYFQRQEVRELIALLRAIDDPTDEVAVVAALRSPAFACSDEDLLLHRRRWRFDYLSLPREAEGLVADGLRALATLARGRHDRTLAEVVREVIDELRLVEFAMLQHQGEQAAANVLKVIDQARVFAQARRSAGLRGFVRWLKENVAREADEVDASVTEEADDAVRVVTAYAAKGLEFPVVIFANMHGDRSNWTNVIVSRTNQSVEMKLGDSQLGFKTPGYDDANIDEKEHAEAEMRRMLYVAATRARDHLVVPIVTVKSSTKSSETKAEKSALDHLRTAGVAEWPNVIDAAALPAIATDVPALRAALEPGPDREEMSIASAREAWRAERAQLVAAGSAGLRFKTASSLKSEIDAPYEGGSEVRRGRAMEFGTAVHAVLERVDLAHPEGLPELAARIAAAAGMPGRAGEIEQCARNVLQHEVTARAIASPRCLREVAFTAPLPGAADGGLAEGRIDLLFVEDGEVVVVDFKTDAVGAGEAAERAGAYREQAQVYAWNAGAATGLPVREVVFLFARIPQAVSLTVDAAFLAEAEELLRLPLVAI